MFRRPPVIKAFVMLGFEDASGARVVASTDLTKFEHSANCDPEPVRFGDSDYEGGSYSTFRPGRRWYTVEATMNDCFVATGATMREALMNLLGAWSPVSEEPEPERGIEPPVFPLGRGREHGNDFGGPPTKELNR